MKSSNRIMIMLSIVILSISNLFSQFAGGDGSPGDPYQIANVDQLQFIETNLMAEYKLVADIDAIVTQSWNEGMGFIPIGITTTHFEGRIDGNGYVIYNLFSQVSTPMGGFIGYNGSGGRLFHVRLENVGIANMMTTGALVGMNDGLIEFCSTSGMVNGDTEIGGLVGNNRGMIMGSFSTADVFGGDIVGGLVGVSGGSIENCYSRGAVQGMGPFVGGFIGQNDMIVIASYSSGHVIGAGGFCGMNTMDIQGCKWDVDSSGLPIGIGAGIPGDLTGLPTPLMFVQMSYPGWNFTRPFWTIDEGTSYPYFIWEGFGPIIEPENISSVINGTNFDLSWDALTGVDGYKVYASDDPYGTFTEVANITTNSWSVGLTEAKEFYYITSYGGF